MIPEIRKAFNDAFTEEKYAQLQTYIGDYYGYIPTFRIAETPLFISPLLKDRLLHACQDISDVLLECDIKTLTTEALYSDEITVPGEDEHTTFLQMDFGIVLDENGEPYPMLIEIQGFPSVYFFQDLLMKAYRHFFDIPEGMTAYFGDINSDTYRQMLKDVIVGDTNPEHVVLLEIEPKKQNTYIDMLSTSVELGIPCLCVTEIYVIGTHLYYNNAQDRPTRIFKIYNRVIFDELQQRSDLPLRFSFTKPYEVEWIGHPNWFYRISKFILPYLKSPYVPETHFVHQLKAIPEDLENYVLKPLFSFSGSGVIIDVTEDDIRHLKDPSNYILQKKVTYHPILQAPDEPVKCEIRVLMLWPKGTERPIPVTNLVRLSKGKMIGVKYNKDKTWVGGSLGFMPQ